MPDNVGTIELDLGVYNAMQARIAKLEHEYSERNHLLIERRKDIRRLESKVAQWERVAEMYRQQHMGGSRACDCDACDEMTWTGATYAMK
jgi:hypothetical protein